MRIPTVVAVIHNYISYQNIDGQGQTNNMRRPSHHVNDTQNLFKNPWSSYRHPGNAEFRDSWSWLWRASPPSNAKDLVPHQKPDWGIAAAPETLKATWLGHAGFLIELPTPPNASRGPRILLDPVFSYRCSPFKWFGPPRYTEPPCKLEELPDVDVIALSHKHYDHMDAATLRGITFPKNTSTPNVHIFMPLNNDAPIDIPRTHFHCLDWWQSSDIVVDLPAKESNHGSSTVDTGTPLVRTTFRLTCTPSQHQTALSLKSGDTWPNLWSSWTIESNPHSLTATAAAQELAGGTPTSTTQARARNVKVWFAGDTGYRTVHIGEDESNVPVCPAFKEIGDKFGGFDLALLPIGAYKPRGLLSCIHCSPSDAVRLFSDLKAKKAIAMHWGTWNLGSESFNEPIELLKQECEKAGLKSGEFEPCAIGETVAI